MKTRLPKQVLRYILNALQGLIKRAADSPKFVAEYWRGAKEDYDAIVTKDPTTLYIVEDDAARVFEENINTIKSRDANIGYGGESYIDSVGLRYFVGYSNNSVAFRKSSLIKQYFLAKPFDLSQAHDSGISLDLFDYSPSTVDYNFIKRFQFSEDGTKIFFSDIAVSTPDYWIYCLDLSAPWNLSNPTFNSANKLQVPAMINFSFVQDGSLLFAIRSSTNAITKYELSTPYDLTTATEVESTNLSDIVGFKTPEGAPTFSPDGTKFYLNTNTEIFQATLTTPFDLKTKIADASIATHGTPTNVVFNKDGTELTYLVNKDGGGQYEAYLNRYKLAIPYDISIEQKDRETSLYLGEYKIGV